MKTHYSCLLIASISSISMVMNIGLSAKPGLSAESGDICTYIPTGERVVYLWEEMHGSEYWIYIGSMDGKNATYVQSSDIDCASNQ